MKKVFCLILSCLFICLSGCNVAKETNEPNSDYQLIGKRVDNMDWANETRLRDENTNMILSLNDFDADLLDYVLTANDNHVVSPLSFRYALAMLLVGANNETKEELLKGLNINDVDEFLTICESFNDYLSNTIPQDGSRQIINKELDVNISIANSIWKREKIEQDFKDSYKEYINNKFAAEYYLFEEKSVVKEVNKWASEKTNDMIKQLLPDDYDTNNLAIILMNAIYLKNSWLNRFDEVNTYKDKFTTYTGEEVEKDFMHITDGFYYYVDKDTELVIIPMYYDINMLFVKGDTTNLDKKVSEAAYHKMTISIPKIEVETTYNQKEFVNYLSEKGILLPFDSANADFSNMIDYDIFVDDIIQKAKIKLDENGVEAAAVTAIITTDSAVAPIEETEPFIFEANEPFNFYIYQNTCFNTSLLFAGNYNY